MKVGVVHNPRSHANMGRDAEYWAPDDVMLVKPATLQALEVDLRAFAARGVELLVIDGGDGTIRDVLSLLPLAFGDAPPLIALLASGKTNVLAIDLGVPRDWTLPDAIAAAAKRKHAVIKHRAPLEVSWDDDRPTMRGFVFGLGAFVRATNMSKSVNRMGAFHGLSVGLTLAGAAAGALFGGARDHWREGVPVELSIDGAPAPPGNRFLLMATTLKRMPLGIKPFGPPREGLKTLDVDAQPKRLLKALTTVLGGGDAPWLAKRGYRRGDAKVLRIQTCDAFVLDGEVYEASGAMTVALGPTLRFLAS